MSAGLFSSRDYRLWWAGNLISTIGTAMALVAYPLLVLKVTGSPLQAGVTATLEVLPFAVLSVPAGVLADRLPRRALLAGSALVSAASAASIAMAGLPGTWHIYLVATINGLAGMVYGVTQMAVLPRIAAPEHLGQAATQSELIWNLSSIAGPPLAGLLMLQSPVLPFAADACSFLVVAFCVLMVRAPLDSPQRTAPSWRADLFTGGRLVLRDSRLRALTLITVAGDLLFAGIAVLMAVLVSSDGTGPGGVGGVFALAALGGVIGSLAARPIEDRIGLRAAVVVRGWATAALFPLLALGLAPAWVGAVWAGISVMISAMNVIQARALLASVPEDALGRVQGFMSMLGYGVLPAGTVLTGACLQAAGPRVTVLVLSGLHGLVALYGTLSRGLARKPSGLPVHSGQ
ncbi:MFS transporter [Longispora albida]|uniref:MFS transporter n=1 Tax=Longispora albida TaxID=203523 RepID=UPI00037CDF33|nr:MFS transporter [Longispora albida]